MPNWCDNDLRVEGNKALLKVFQEYVKGPANVLNPSEGETDFSFHKILPIPDEILANHNRGGMKWYDWCVENWGTKWQPTEVFSEEDSLGVWCAFDTAWSPPEGVILKASRTFPELLFRLTATPEGEDTIVLEIVNGKIIKEETVDESEDA